MARKRGAAQSSGYTILVVDDQEEILTSSRFLLEREGHTVITAMDGPTALHLFRQHQIHLLLVDYFMPGMNGEDLIKEIRKLDAEVQIVLQTGYAGEKPPRTMLHALEIQGYHDKTEGPERLLLWVDVALKSAAQLQRVRRAEQLKADLLANVSHELRTPINIILGYSEILLDGESNAVTPTARRAIVGIKRQAHTLNELVNDFLNFAKIQAETIEVSPQAITVAALEEELHDLVTFALGGKPIQFQWRIGPSAPQVWADLRKVRIILGNLLSNAAKFTEHGAITVALTPVAARNAVDITVQDTGIGIAPEHHQLIFELFQQVDGSPTRRFGGMGIGLALARKLARLMEGELTVESNLGTGSIFKLTLPLFSTQQPTAPTVMTGSTLPLADAPKEQLL